YSRVVDQVLVTDGASDGVRQLGRYGNGDGQVMLLGPWLPALEASGIEGQKPVDGPAAPQHGRGVAEGRHHPVPGLESEDAADLRGLLPLDWGEGTDPTLALELEH